jgi:hypothetical protein
MKTTSNLGEGTENRDNQNIGTKNVLYVSSGLKWAKEKNNRPTIKIANPQLPKKPAFPAFVRV